MENLNKQLKETFNRLKKHGHFKQDDSYENWAKRKKKPTRKQLENVVDLIKKNN